MSKLHIVMYHYVRDLKYSRYPRIKGLDVALFRRQIDFLYNNFSIVTMEDVINELESGGGYFPENAVLLTFDDGYIDHYTYVLPILEEKKIQGSFFISGKTFTSHQLLDVNKIHYIFACADSKRLLADVYEKMDYYRGQEFDYPSNEEMFLQHAELYRFDEVETAFIKKMLQTVLPERLRKQIIQELFQKYVGIPEEQLACELYMTKEQIRLMKSHGMYIGIHGYDHFWLSNLPIDEVRKDIQVSLDVLDEFIDRRQWVMNYPYGVCNFEVIQAIKENGACLGLTTEAAIADLSCNSRFELPRLDCNDFPPKSENYKIM